MSVMSEMFKGYAQRIRLENSLQLQKAKIERPPQVKLEITATLKKIADELKDPEVKAIFDAIEITVPEGI